MNFSKVAFIFLVVDTMLSEFSLNQAKEVKHLLELMFRIDDTGLNILKYLYKGTQIVGVA